MAYRATIAAHEPRREECSEAVFQGSQPEPGSQRGSRAVRHDLRSGGEVFFFADTASRTAIIITGAFARSDGAPARRTFAFLWKTLECG